MMTYQCRLIDCNKHTTLVRDWEQEWPCMRRDKGDMVNLCTFNSTCYEPKTAIRDKFLLPPFKKILQAQRGGKKKRLASSILFLARSRISQWRREEGRWDGFCNVCWQTCLSLCLLRTQRKEYVINDELPGRIITGRVLIKPSVKEVKEDSVIFTGPPEEQPIDIIVFATGYTFAFPFLDETVVKVENDQASLYKYIFPAHLEKPTLAVIGFINALGSMIPTGETQARWAVRVLKGKCMRNRADTFGLPCYFGS